MLSYLTLFFLYSFVGWIIDSSYRSVEAKKYSSGSFLPFLAPIYGVAGVSLTLFFQWSSLSLFLDILLGTVLVVMIEFFGGIFCVCVFGRRYWDYSKETYNLLGHISLLHSVYWLLLVIGFRLLFPFFFS
jgi:uncharacterized membrane protein